MLQSVDFMTKCKSNSNKKHLKRIDKMEEDLKANIEASKAKVIRLLDSVNYTLPGALKRPKIKATMHYSRIAKQKEAYVDKNKPREVIDFDDLPEKVEETFNVLALRNYENSILPSHPWLKKSITTVTPIACDFFKDVGMTRVCAMTRLGEFLPSDDLEEVRISVTSRLDDVEMSVFEAVQIWQDYFYTRPGLAVALAKFPKADDDGQALRRADAKMVMDTSTFLAEVAHSYNVLTKVLSDVTEYVEPNVVKKWNWFNFYR